MSYLTRLAAQLGYAVHTGIAYGRTNGIYFNVTCTPDGTSVVVRAYIRPIETLTFKDIGRGKGIDLPRIQTYAKVQRREYPNSGAEADERSVWVTLDGKFISNPSRAAQFIAEFARFLSAQGYVSSCAECPQTRQLIHAGQDSQVLELCSACQNRLAAAPVGEIRKNRLLVRGILAAAGGAMIVAVLWVLLSSAWPVVSLFGLVMAYIADRSYRAAGGWRGRAEAATIATVLIVMPFLAATFGYAYNRYQMINPAEGMTYLKLAGSYLAALLGGGKKVGALWLWLGTGWLFSALGGFALILQGRRRTAAKRAENTLRKTRHN